MSIQCLRLLKIRDVKCLNLFLNTDVSLYIYIKSKVFNVSLRINKIFDIFSTLFLCCLMNLRNSIGIALKILVSRMLIVWVIYQHMHISNKNYKKSYSSCLYGCNKMCVIKYYMYTRILDTYVTYFFFLNSELFLPKGVSSVVSKYKQLIFNHK